MCIYLHVKELVHGLLNTKNFGEFYAAVYMDIIINNYDEYLYYALWNIVYKYDISYAFKLEIKHKKTEDTSVSLTDRHDILVLVD